MPEALLPDLLHGDGMKPAPTHAFEECTGAWRLAGSGRSRWIRCCGCAAVHTATQDARRAAIDENRAGLVLRRLTAEGNVLLDSDPGR